LSFHLSKSLLVQIHPILIDSCQVPVGPARIEPQKFIPLFCVAEAQENYYPETTWIGRLSLCRIVRAIPATVWAGYVRMRQGSR